MKRIALCSAALVMLACVAAVAATAAETVSGCVRCHTDEALLKSLFVPPKIDGGEGEG